jgi:hypothetical protein
MPIYIRYGDKNSFLSQRLDISPVTPSDALFAGVAYGNRSRIWSVMRIDTEMLRSNFDVSEDV